MFAVDAENVGFRAQVSSRRIELHDSASRPELGSDNCELMTAVEVVRPISYAAIYLENVVWRLAVKSVVVPAILMLIIA